MFGPSLTYETSVVLTARYCQLLRPLLTSLIPTRGTETSPGKGGYPSIYRCYIYNPELMHLKGFAMLC